MSDERKTKRLRAEAGPAADVYTLDSAVAMLLKRFDETDMKIDSFKVELNTKLDTMREEFQHQIDVIKQDINLLQTNCDSEHETFKQSVNFVNN